MGEYRSKGRGLRWTWNPLRWLAAPMIVASLGTLGALTGSLLQMVEGGLSWWGGLAALGTLVSVGAIAWTQSDLTHIKNRERNRNPR